MLQEGSSDFPKVSAVVSSTPIGESQALGMLSQFLSTEQQKLQHHPQLEATNHWEDLYLVAHTLTANDQEKSKLLGLKSVASVTSGEVAESPAAVKREAQTVDSDSSSHSEASVESPAEQEGAPTLKDENKLTKEERKAKKAAKKAEREAKRKRKESRKTEKVERREMKKQKRERKSQGGVKNEAN
jgi:hypothetical protein